MPSEGAWQLAGVPWCRFLEKWVTLVIAEERWGGGGVGRSRFLWLHLHVL